MTAYAVALKYEVHRHNKMRHCTFFK